MIRIFCGLLVLSWLFLVFWLILFAIGFVDIQRPEAYAIVIIGLTCFLPATTMELQ